MGPVDLPFLLELLGEPVSAKGGGYILLTKAILRSLRAMKYLTCWLVTSYSMFFCFLSTTFRKC